MGPWSTIDRMHGTLVATVLRIEDVRGVRIEAAPFLSQAKWFGLRVSGS